MEGEWTRHNFKSFVLKKDSSEDGKIIHYDFKNIKKLDRQEGDNGDEKRGSEINHAKEKEFKISPIVSHYRGLKEHQQRNREKRIEGEVNNKVREIGKRAYEKGYTRGLEKGREESLRKMEEVSKEKIAALEKMVEEVSMAKAEIITYQKRDIYKLIKSLTKWVILKELKNDGEYVQRLLEKILLEFQSRNNLLLKVNQKDFEKMPEVLELVQENVGTLKNVRVEVNYSSDLPGISVESKDGIIDGSLKQQFKNLNKLFESIV